MILCVFLTFGLSRFNTVVIVIIIGDFFFGRKEAARFALHKRFSINFYWFTVFVFAHILMA